MESAGAVRGDTLDPGACLMTFPLFASIKPPSTADELAYLHTCVLSWRTAGFAPVAVNGPREIEALRGLDLPIEFAALEADGKPRIGGPERQDFTCEKYFE